MSTPVASAKPVAPKQSTAPNAPAANLPPAEKPALKPYPGLQADDKGNATVKLKDWPADFDPKVHARLRKVDFENEAPFLEHLADEFERRAKKLRQEANDAKTLGSQASRAAVKKLRGLQEQYSKLAEMLKAQGIDPSMVLNNVQSAPEAAKA